MVCIRDQLFISDTWRLIAQFGSDTVSGRRRRLIGFQTTWLQHESWEFQLDHARMHHFLDGDRWTSRGIRIRFTFKKSEGPRVTSIFAYPLSLSLSLLFISISFPSFLQIYHLSEKITMSHYPIIGSNVLGFFKNSKPFRGGQVPVRVIPEAEAEGLCEPEMPEPEFQIELPGSVGRLRNVLDPWLSLLRKVGGVGTEGLELFSSLGKLTLLSQPC